MKSLKDHLMFILPLFSILVGIEFFLVFDRVTNKYEQNLKENYSILVVSKKYIDENKFKKVDKRIERVEEIKRDDIATQIAKRMGDIKGENLLKALPYFYSIHLNSYLSDADIEDIKIRLLKYPHIKRVETFGESHNSKYNLFIFIKTLFWVFAGLMGMVSLFLIIKQMEVWQMAHMERMRIMEIFGAPMMLRSGVLFKMGIIDAIVSTILASSIFIALKYWAPKSGILLLVKEKELLFQNSDFTILVTISLSMVIVAVVSVAVGTKEIIE